MSEFEGTVLWKDFAGKATAEEQAMVAALTRKTGGRLDLVRDTFPTYTLHNERHALMSCSAWVICWGPPSPS